MRAACHSLRMEGDAVTLTQDIALGLWAQAELFLRGLLRPWNAYQVGIAVVLFAAAHLANRLLGPVCHDWMRRREGWPKWRMRLLVMLHRRLRLIFFVILMWPTVWILRATTWPSRSYMLSIFAELALAWLTITILTRLIANGFLRALVRYAGWTWATLIILNLTDEAQTLLDGLAFELGHWGSKSS